MNTDSFIENIKTDYVYKDIADDIKKGLTHQTMKLKDCQQQVFGLMRDELGEKIMTQLQLDQKCIHT